MKKVKAILKTFVVAGIMLIVCIADSIVYNGDEVVNESFYNLLETIKRILKRK